MSPERVVPQPSVWYRLFLLDFLWMELLFNSNFGLIITGTRKRRRGNRRNKKRGGERVKYISFEYSWKKRM